MLVVLFYLFLSYWFISGFCQEDHLITLNKSSIVSSPLYPSIYPHNLECLWIFTTSRGLYCLLQFVDVSIDDDLLTIGVGPIPTIQSILMEISGYNVKPVSLTLNSTEGWLKLSSNANGNSHGFYINITATDYYGKYPQSLSFLEED